MDIASSMIGMQQNQKAGALGAIFMKQQQEQDTAMVNMLEQATKAPKAAGTGLVVDKSA